MKQCKKCLIEKDLSEFYRHPSTRDWYINKCISCISKYNHSDEWRDKQRSYDKKRLKDPKRIAYNKVRFENFKINHPEKRNAQVILWNSKRRKCNQHLLTNVCVVCWSIWIIHYHHFDYSKQKEVIPCCPMCHSKFHHNRLQPLDKYKVTFI